jgi:hypothetical protein
MSRLSGLLVVLLTAGCSSLPFHGEGEDESHNRVPMICSPDRTQLSCTNGVEVGHAYPFNLLTHCGIEWAYGFAPAPASYRPPDCL